MISISRVSKLVAMFSALTALSVFEMGVQEAEAAAVSRCLALAEAAPVQGRVHLAAITPTAGEPVALKANEVRITFAGHSTFRIESPGGIMIATDYAGYAGDGRLPDVVTMNHAHETHFTNYPDPAIKHVLRGWNPNGGAAEHDLTVGDVKIRNVPTDLRNWDGTREVDGNSIFIFEVAGLCIGHLGHLHHELTPQYLGWIGQLDVVMVPVDGSFTMAQVNMVEVMKTLRARLIIPMHFFGPDTLDRFVDKLRGSFPVKINDSAEIVISDATLPGSPNVMVLPGF